MDILKSYYFSNHAEEYCRSGVDIGLWKEERLPLIIESLKFYTQMKIGENLSFKNEPTIILNVVFDQRSFIISHGSGYTFSSKSHY